MLTWRISLLLLFLLIALSVLQYRLWYQSGGIYDFMALKKKLATQEQINLEQKKINESLLFQIKRLQNSLQAVESRARDELGMIKKDEVFFQIVNDEQQQSQRKIINDRTSHENLNK